jgi:hypothetical protein
VAATLRHPHRYGTFALFAFGSVFVVRAAHDWLTDDATCAAAVIAAPAVPWG